MLVSGKKLRVRPEEYESHFQAKCHSDPAAKATRNVYRQLLTGPNGGACEPIMNTLIRGDYYGKEPSVKKMKHKPVAVVMRNKLLQGQPRLSPAQRRQFSKLLNGNSHESRWMKAKLKVAYKARVHTEGAPSPDLDGSAGTQDSLNTQQYWQQMQHLNHLNRKRRTGEEWQPRGRSSVSPVALAMTDASYSENRKHTAHNNSSSTPPKQHQLLPQQLDSRRHDLIRQNGLGNGFSGGAGHVGFGREAKNTFTNTASTTNGKPNGKSVGYHDPSNFDLASPVVRQGTPPTTPTRRQLRPENAWPAQAKDRFTDTDEVAAGEHGRSAAAVPQSALLEQRDARNSARRVVKKACFTRARSDPNLTCGTEDLEPEASGTVVSDGDRAVVGSSHGRFRRQLADAKTADGMLNKQSGADLLCSSTRRPDTASSQRSSKMPATFVSEVVRSPHPRSGSRSDYKHHGIGISDHTFSARWMNPSSFVDQRVPIVPYDAVRNGA
ncbi:hypothetical protein DIPPA_19048 [Diplonema papillatum]|nr:hypothetical protein DIPPA_19048 [Diplonema papillatum]